MEELAKVFQAYFKAPEAAFVGLYLHYHAGKLDNVEFVVMSMRTYKRKPIHAKISDVNLAALQEAHACAKLAMEWVEAHHRQHRESEA